VLQSIPNIPQRTKENTHFLKSLRSRTYLNAPK